MTKFLIGVVFGVVIATVGFQGVARMLDTGVSKVKATSVELAR
jgi:hypothetical protein